jgi:hypothetical protein
MLEAVYVCYHIRTWYNCKEIKYISFAVNLHILNSTVFSTPYLFLDTAARLQWHVLVHYMVPSYTNSEYYRIHINGFKMWRFTAKLKYLWFLCKFTSWSCGCIEKQIRCWKNCWYSYNIDKCNKILCLSLSVCFKLVIQSGRSLFLSKIKIHR